MAAPGTLSIAFGAGERHFCTGADVGAVAKSARVSGTGPVTDEVFWSPHQNRVWKPVICAVNGLVVGGGLHFVVDSDIIVAADQLSNAVSNEMTQAAGCISSPTPDPTC